MGYPQADGDYLLLENEEIDAVRLVSTRAIDIDSFVTRGSMDWIWCNQPYFLSSAYKVRTEAFCVIRETMAASGVAGIGKYGDDGALGELDLEGVVGKGFCIGKLCFGGCPERRLGGGLAS